jgi:hypothetical protein
MDLEQRGHGTAHERFEVGIPRDGGIADLLAEAASPNPRFAAVICEDIERSGRDTFNALTRKLGTGGRAAANPGRGGGEGCALALVVRRVGRVRGSGSGSRLVVWGGWLSAGR